MDSLKRLHPLLGKKLWGISHDALVLGLTMKAIAARREKGGATKRGSEYCGMLVRDCLETMAEHYKKAKVFSGT